MQGKKDYQEKLFSSFQLSNRVLENNFYNRLKEVLALCFLYDFTNGFYGVSGQQRIDLVVFFKLCLVGYFENSISDRQLMLHCAMRLQILFLKQCFQPRMLRSGYYEFSNDFPNVQLTA
ncbi:hypothetical protein [Maribacter sp.]|uniref:hypothetical protein n=1 Tax=Maribacter sp. TaxID=1897614 RepID=UPI00329A4C43